MDLASFSAPIAFETPLGRLEVNARLAPFQDWLGDGLRAKRWPDGASLVRALLLEHARLSGSGEPLESEPVTALTAGDLDATASALLEASGTLFQPRLIGSGVGSRRRFRKRRADETYDMSPRNGESPSARFLRIASDWREDQVNQNRMLLQDSLPAASRIAEELRRISPAWEIIREQRSMTATSRLSSAIEAAKAFNEPSFKAALSSVPTLTSTFAMTEPTWLKTAGDLKRAWPTFAALQDVASSLSVSTHPSRQLQETMRSITVASSLADFSVVRDQATFARVISRQFDLHMPAVISAIAAMQASTGALADMAVFPPGYQAVAMAGMAGGAPRGAVADILRLYGDDTEDDAPVFASAIGQVQALDDDSITPEQAENALLVFLDGLWKVISNENDVIKRFGFLMLALTIMQTMFAWQSVSLAQRSLELAERPAIIQPAPELITRLDDLQNEVAALRADETDRARHHRYLRAKAPLRIEPHARAAVMRIVYPDQTLRVVDTHGDWAKVDVFDYGSDAVTTGWISRRHLRQTPLP